MVRGYAWGLMATSITLTNISKVFGAGAGAARAVDGVDLHIPEGELFFLLGPSGCGKTTLLRMIAGFMDPSTGFLRFGERDVTHAPPNKRNTGMVFQSYALWPHMTVAQNVAFGLNVRKVGGEERAARVKEALDAVHMGQYADRKPTQLSGGQQQRVALARALVVRPDVLLLDEPLSNLDARLRIELRSEIRRICKTPLPGSPNGITTIYVTHDQKEALSMADRIAVMRAGKVVQIGGPADLYRNPADRFVAEFLGEANMVPGLVRTIDGGRAVIETPAGDLVSTHRNVGELAGGVREVLCCLRPEALRVEGATGGGARGGEDREGGSRLEAGGPVNVLEGRITQTTYLGEIAHHHVEAPGHTDLRVAELNPDPRLLRAEAPAVRITVDPGDVIVLQEGDG